MKYLVSMLLLGTLPLIGTNLIEEVQVSKNRLRIIANKEFTTTYLRQNFYAHYSPELNLEGLGVTILTIPFVMNVAPIIWLSNKSYTIDAMDQDLYESLGIVQKIFQAFYPKNRWAGELIPKKLIKNTILPQKNTVAALFSHGLDAVYTSLHNQHTKQVLITVCGGDIPVHQDQMWQNVKNLCRSFAQQFGHTNAFVRSNFNIFRNFKYLTSQTHGEIHNWFGQTSQSLSYIGLAAPIAYLYGCPKILLASTRTSDNPFPYGTHPVIDNNLAYAGIMVHHDGPEVDRIEKIREIAHLCLKDHLPKPMLRVCWGKDPQGGNCNHCEKCFRTIVELLVEGQIPSDYGFMLPLDMAIKTARAQAPGKKVLDSGLMWHWQCIQKGAQRTLQQSLHTIDHPEFKPFITWLAHLDLRNFKNPATKERSKEEKEAFALLWKKATERNFYIADLIVIAPFRRHARADAAQSSLGMS